MRSAIKSVLKAGTAEAGKTALQQAMQRIDKAAKTHVIHRNAASRFKSRPAQRVARLG
jgi:small subunit ribosomal protein S20